MRCAAALAIETLQQHRLSFIPVAQEALVQREGEAVVFTCVRVTIVTLAAIVEQRRNALKSPGSYRHSWRRRWCTCEVVTILVCQPQHLQDVLANTQGAFQDLESISRNSRLECYLVPGGHMQHFVQHADLCFQLERVAHALHLRCCVAHLCEVRNCINKRHTLVSSRGHKVVPSCLLWGAARTTQIAMHYADSGTPTLGSTSPCTL